MATIRMLETQIVLDPTRTSAAGTARMWRCWGAQRRPRPAPSWRLARWQMPEGEENPTNWAPD